MVFDTGEVFDSSPSDEDNAVFLQIVADAGDVGVDFKAVGEADTGDFSEGGVGFFGSDSEDPHADSSFLRAAGQSRRFGFGFNQCSFAADELIQSRHSPCFMPQSPVQVNPQPAFFLAPFSPLFFTKSS